MSKDVSIPETESTPQIVDVSIRETENSDATKNKSDADKNDDFSTNIVNSEIDQESSYCSKFHTT